MVPANMTIYNQDGLRADYEDGAVSLYLEGKHVITMTVAEWDAINSALWDVSPPPPNSSHASA